MAATTQCKQVPNDRLHRRMWDFIGNGVNKARHNKNADCGQSSVDIIKVSTVDNRGDASTRSINERKTHITSIECDAVVAVVGLGKILAFPMDGFKLDPRFFGSGVGCVGSFCLSPSLHLRPLLVSVLLMMMDPFLGGVPCLGSLLHDAPDDGAKGQGGILELFDLVVARKPFQSHQCGQFLGCFEDPEVVRQSDVEGDRDVLGGVCTSDFARQRARRRRYRRRTSFLVRHHRCEVLEQVL